VMRVSKFVVVMLAFIAASACSGFVYGCGSEPEGLILRCTYAGDSLEDVFSLDVKGGTVQLLSVNPPRPGVLTVTDAVYQLEFPENHPKDGYKLLKVDINRITTVAERVIGREQTVMYEGKRVELHAMQHSGKCARVQGVAF
jgi:hypothetical protein